MRIKFNRCFKPFEAGAYMPVLRNLVSQTPVFSFSFVDRVVWIFTGDVANPSGKVKTGQGSILLSMRKHLY